MTLSGSRKLARVTVSLRSVLALHDQIKMELCSSLHDQMWWSYAHHLHTNEVLPPARDLSGVPRYERLVALVAGTFGSGPQPLKLHDKAFGSAHDAVESTGHMEGSETSQPLKK